MIVWIDSESSHLQWNMHAHIHLVCTLACVISADTIMITIHVYLRYCKQFWFFFGPNLFIYLLKILTLCDLIAVTFSKVIILNFFRPRHFLLPSEAWGLVLIFLSYKSQYTANVYLSQLIYIHLNFTIHVLTCKVTHAL